MVARTRTGVLFFALIATVLLSLTSLIGLRRDGGSSLVLRRGDQRTHWFATDFKVERSSSVGRLITRFHNSRGREKQDPAATPVVRVGQCIAYEQVDLPGVALNMGQNSKVRECRSHAA